MCACASLRSFAGWMMKALSDRLKILAAAFGAVLLLGFFLLRAQGGAGQQAAFPTAAVLVVGVPAAIAWWLRRRNARDERRSAGSLTNLDSLKLQPGRTLHLIDLEGQRLLVSSSENGIRLVYRIDPAKDARPATDCEAAS